MQALGLQRGFSLMEVMISVSLSTLLMSGIVLLLSGSVSAYRLQLSQGHLEESGRYAREVLVSHVTQAGFRPEPWQDQPALTAVTGESADGEVVPGDQLGLQRWSRKNCYGNENPVTGSNGQPAFFILQTRFRVNSTNNLAITCRYGPDDSRLQTQINNFGLVEDIEAMQVLYAEDGNGDQVADGWVRAKAWQQESEIRAIKIALLLATPGPFTKPASKQVTLLDETTTTPADGHLRNTMTITAAIRGRL